MNKKVLKSILGRLPYTVELYWDLVQRHKPWSAHYNLDILEAELPKAANQTALFAPAAALKPVYIFAGDVGAWGGNLTPFYQPDAASGATLLATGVGDSPADSLLEVEVTSAGTEVSIFPLDGQDFLPLVEFNLDYWEQTDR